LNELQQFYLRLNRFDSGYSQYKQLSSDGKLRLGLNKYIHGQEADKKLKS